MERKRRIQWAVRFLRLDHSSLVSAGWSWGSNGPGSGEQYGRLNERNGVEMSYKNTGQTLRGMTTCEPSERITSCPSMSSAGDSPAKTSRSLARELASQVLAAVCGSSMRELLASYDHDSSSWRTSQRSLLAGSPECLVTLPRSGTIRSGSLCALPTLGHHTEESDSSSWATPQAHDATATGKSTYGRDPVREVLFWPTPTSRDWKDGDCRNANVESNGLLGRVALERQPKGSLNPDWVEALMGFSPGWTDGLPDEAKPSTRGNRRASRRKRTKDGSG